MECERTTDLYILHVAGAHVWGARICYWSPEQLQQLYRSEVAPTPVYKYGGMPGPTDQRTWNGLLSVLQQPQPQPQQQEQRQEQTEQQPTAADQTAVPAGSQRDGSFRNVLLLHVAGRYNDFSIKVCSSSISSGALCVNMYTSELQNQLQPISRLVTVFGTSHGALALHTTTCWCHMMYRKK